MAQQLTQWEVEWAQEKLQAPTVELSAMELHDALLEAPDSELYDLALSLLREAGETQH